MKNIVITGSTRGLGLEMAIEFLRCGCNVTISGSKPESINNAKDRLEDFMGRYIYITCNVRNIIDIKELWFKSVERWESVDVWVNNAG
jgi:NADP-dependent 3-hydroxy acid dehydrogenase YdfG